MVNTHAAHDLVSDDDPRYHQGLKIYADYCSRCHGEHANGRGRIVPLYVKMKSALPSNFQIGLYAFRPKEYLASIVRDGGEKHSLSQYMPPFGGELTANQIDDVVYFIQRISQYSGKTSLHETK
ncbi:c-type cytochrome [Kaarinaea lacus]